MTEIVNHFKILDTDNKKKIGEALGTQNQTKHKIELFESQLKKMLKECLEI